MQQTDSLHIISEGNCKVQDVNRRESEHFHITCVKVHLNESRRIVIHIAAHGKVQKQENVPFLGREY